MWRLCLRFALKRMVLLIYGSHVPAKGANRLVGAVDDDGNIPSSRATTTIKWYRTRDVEIVLVLLQ